MAAAAQDILDGLLAGTDVRAAVVLGRADVLLAGSEGLADPARRLLAAAPDADVIEVATSAGAVFAARSAAHSIAVVCRRGALPALVSYDLRRALALLEADLPAAA